MVRYTIRSGLAVAALLAMLMAGISGAADWKVGDRVEAFNVTWYKATITEIGGGKYAGHYRVRYDGFSQMQYLAASSIRAIPGAGAGSTGAKGEAKAGAQPQLGSGDGPRPGKYLIMSYGATGMPPLVLGSFVLGKGSYEAFLVGGRSTGTGRYDYNAATRTVNWSSGPYAGVWGGGFTVERDGRTHKIRMKSTTIGTNSVN